MYRLCIDCGKPTTQQRCPADTALWRKRKARNYGPQHHAARQALAATLPARCGYCARMIGVGERWVAAHERDGDPTSRRLVAHPACNERAKTAIL